VKTPSNQTGWLITISDVSLTHLNKITCALTQYSAVLTDPEAAVRHWSYPRPIGRTVTPQHVDCLTTFTRHLIFAYDPGTTLRNRSRHLRLADIGARQDDWFDVVPRPVSVPGKAVARLFDDTVRLRTALVLSFHDRWYQA
jgi:hypothetical protein